MIWLIWHWSLKSSKREKFQVTYQVATHGEQDGKNIFDAFGIHVAEQKADSKKSINKSAKESMKGGKESMKDPSPKD